MSSFFFFFSYLHQLRIQESRQYDKLQALVSSLGINIDADEIDLFLARYPSKDDIKTVADDSLYFHYQELMNEVVKYNHVNSPMYMLTYNEDKKYFEYLIRSDNNVYYRHAYVEFPDELLLNYEIGGVIPKYETENGVWLSAFFPIKNSQNTVVALLEADINFKSFIDDVRSQYVKTGSWTLFAVLGLALVLIFYARKILRKEQEQMEKSEYQSSLIEQKNKDINASISYAKRIQASIFPLEKNFECFASHFFLFKPKDIVSGDFFWLYQSEDYVYLAVADCTGHGVPGAMVSMICSEALNYVIKALKVTDVGEVLDAVSNVVEDRFSKGDGIAKDGMDISLCRIDLNRNRIQYAGANNPIYVITQNGMSIYKPDRQPIGEFSHRKKFNVQEFLISKGDKVYLFTDGFVDQFGGPKDKKYKSMNFKSLLYSSSHLSMKNQGSKIDKELMKWMNGGEQVDDICILGIEI